MAAFLAVGLWASLAHARELTGFVEAGPVWFEDGYVLVEPGLAWESEALALELTAPLLLRVIDFGGGDRGPLRRADWDERSDYGRFLRRFSLTLADGAVVLRAGALSWERIGHGTLFSGYSNTLNPDRHPAGAALTLAAGPVTAQAIWSDLLASRAGGGALVFEPLSLIGDAPNDRVHLIVQGGLDLGAPGTQALALWGLGIDAAVVRSTLLRLSPYVDFNRRGSGSGLHAGLLADLTIAGVDVGLRAEWRRTWGPYQPEWFDLAYEIEREDLLGAPKAAHDFGVGNGWRAEARVQYRALSIALASSSRGPDVQDASASIGAEVGDLSFALFGAARAFDDARAPDKVFALGEVRYRFGDYFHLWLEGGRIHRLMPREGGGVSAPAVTRIGAGLGGALAWLP